MAILMTVAMPVWKTAVQRDKEAELIFRGLQYARAIELYQRKLPGAAPPNLDVLLDQKFLRKKYKDPITNEDFDLLSPNSPAAALGGAPPQAGGRGAPPSGRGPSRPLPRRRPANPARPALSGTRPASLEWPARARPCPFVSTTVAVITTSGNSFMCRELPRQVREVPVPEAPGQRGGPGARGPGQRGAPGPFPPGVNPTPFPPGVNPPGRGPGRGDGRGGPQPFPQPARRPRSGRRSRRSQGKTSERRTWLGRLVTELRLRQLTAAILEHMDTMAQEKHWHTLCPLC